MKMENIYDVIIDLHRWRELFNGEQIGLGHDQYRPDELFHYPEAYAVWGSGYVALYKFTKEKEFLNNAITCADWLIKNKNPNYENISWGLPWIWKLTLPWERENAPQNLSYLITTVFCGDLFLELYRETSKKKYLKLAMSIARWIDEENSWEQTETGIFFYFANFKPLKYKIFNPTAKASAFFAKLFLATENKKYKELSLKSAEFILKSQNPDVSWYYSERSNVIDNFHTGLILDALLDIYFSRSINKEEPLYESLDRGLSFYWKHLFKKSGLAFETYKKNKSLKERFYYVFYPNTSRLWGYGIALKVFSRAIPIFKTEKYVSKIFDYSLNLRQSSGTFNHKINDPRTFIRGEAHIFNGLAHYLLSTRNTNL